MKANSIGTTVFSAMQGLYVSWKFPPKTCLHLSPEPDQALGIQACEETSQLLTFSLGNR